MTQNEQRVETKEMGRKDTEQLPPCFRVTRNMIHKARKTDGGNEDTLLHHILTGEFYQFHSLHHILQVSSTSSTLLHHILQVSSTSSTLLHHILQVSSTSSTLLHHILQVSSTVPLFSIIYYR